MSSCEKNYDPKNRKRYEAIVGAMRFVYFSYYFGVGCIQTFYPVVLKKINVSNTRMGMTFSIGLVGGIISPIFMGFLADKTKKSRIILITITLITMLMHLIPILLIVIKTGLNKASSSAKGNNLVVSDMFIYFLCFCQFFITFGDQGTKALLDSVTHKVIGRSREYGYVVDFSRVRMMGGVGFAFTSLISGICLDYVRYFLPSFPEEICLLTLCFIMCVFCVTTLIIYVPNAETQEEVTLGGTFRSIMEKKKVLVFYCSQFLIQFAINMSKSFETLYITHMGGNKSLIGISMSIGYVADVAMMYFSPIIRDAIGSGELTISYAILITSIRVYIYAYADSPYIAISNSILTGFTLGLYVPNMSSLVKSQAPANLVSSYVSLSTGIGKIGASISSFLGGLISQKLGYKNVYLGAFWAYIAASFCLFFFFKYEQRRLAKEKVVKASSGEETKNMLFSEEGDPTESAPK